MKKAGLFILAAVAAAFCSSPGATQSAHYEGFYYCSASAVSGSGRVVHVSGIGHYRGDDNARGPALNQRWTAHLRDVVRTHGFSANCRGFETASQAEAALSELVQNAQSGRASVVRTVFVP